MSAVLVIAKLNFIDLSRYRQYQAAFPAIFAGSGGEILAADETPTTLSGDVADKIVVMRFPDAETAQAFLTSPDYLPLMQKAAAIVTDEGGILCHAAIVARELGKPCIVSTGNATSKLQNGQIVIVDATAGTVKLT